MIRLQEPEKKEKIGKEKHKKHFFKNFIKNVNLVWKRNGFEKIKETPCSVEPFLEKFQFKRKE